MTSFDKYSNYAENTAHSSIVFGADKPVLEVELNELQQIINTKLSRIITAILESMVEAETITQEEFDYITSVAE